ncbi:zinc-dependent peptidase [Nostoc spongiaeforme FACHB-130]|uniref:Zinc-dependent peptidase n=1 Tax=Nostoc spongiaeforme FACHB-130 TaxID=1357510 RepID=A0ABR8G016_9NOSO|nr:M90 family metallopeptidase [Nostoc spongiaeforme]MBD2596563.1 zinc-dependent peptidase [Nostoc spongiaeforme FACHB-130]
MGAAIIIFLILGLIVTAIFISPVLTKRRRNRLKKRSFPPLWSAVIENNLPIYLRLTPEERRRLQGHIQVFLVEKQFIGCQGLQVTAEMKITIAAVACLLLLNERGEYFPKLRSILIYPSTYFVNQTVAVSDYVVEERRDARLGESWVKDQVILSWEQVQRDTQNWNDGHNVVLHEFAHQLDQEDGKAEGVPILPNKSDYLVWSQVMTAEYQKLCNDIQQDIKTVINSYGATNPAEFFAVATETFFEQPQQLSEKHSQLYDLLKKYYQVHPEHWI